MDHIYNALRAPYNGIVEKGPTLVIIFVVGFLVIRILNKVAGEALRASRVPKALRQMMLSLAIALMWIILIVNMLQTAGLQNIAVALTGSVAILTLVVASGANALVTDLIAGFFLAGDNDFNVGYKIKSGDIEGIIEKIDIRKIRVRDNDGKLHVLPNSMFDRAQWIVLDDNKQKG